MAFTVSAITVNLLKWVVNPLLWLILIVVVIAVIYVFLVIRRKRSMVYGGLELVDLGGNGKFGANFVKCGWIGINLHFNKLWWTGREVMRTKDMEVIHEFSEQDFQEVDGQRGIVFYRDPINKQLYPINRLQVVNKNLISTIPPAEYVDNAIRIFDEATKESSDFKEKLIQFVSWSLVIIFSLVAIIVITQMVKNGQDKAAALIVDSGKVCLENAKSICSQIISTGGATSP